MTARSHPGHIVAYAPGDSFTCRLAATPINLGYTFLLEAAAALTARSHPGHIVAYAPGDSFTCRLAATPINLGYTFLPEAYIEA
ncbi:hypothetical protein GCM10009426_00160 [Rheinheimera tangshanensis]